MLQAAPSSDSLPVEQFQRLPIADKDGEYATLFRRKGQLKTKVALASLGCAGLWDEVKQLRNETAALRMEIIQKET